MECTKFVTRVGGLAIGLGVGAATAALPWVASADPLTSDAGWAADLLSALPAAGGTTPDFAISFDGTSLLQEGNATATTIAGNYGLAIAYGDGSRAIDNGMYGQSYASGTDSTSYIGGGTNSVSIANGADSITNVNGDNNFVEATGYMSSATAVLGNSNIVIDSGANSSTDDGAYVLGGSNDLVTVSGANDLADTGSSNDVLSIVGNNDVQAFTQGLHDIAAIFGDGSTATAGGGDYNLAAVFGDGSNASAEFGNNNLAVVFGDLLDANAIGGNMTDIEPSMSMATAMADLFGGTATDASWLTDFLDGSWLTGLL